MNPSTPHSRLVPLLLAPLLRAVPAVGLMLLLWDRFDTFAPDSADIGGGPLGLLVPSAVAALLAAVDGWRLSRRPAARLWGRTCVWVAVLLLVADLLLRDRAATSPAQTATDVLLAAVVTVVASGLFGLLPLLGIAVGSAGRRTPAA